MSAANNTGKPIVGVEMGPGALAIYGMTPIMRDGKSLAVIDIGVAFGKEFVGRAKERFGVDLAVHNYNGREFTKLASTFGDGVVATQEEMKAVLDGKPLRRDAVLGGHSAALYLGQVKNYAGVPLAVIEVIKDTAEFEAAATGALRVLMLGTGAISHHRRFSRAASRAQRFASIGCDHGGNEPFVRRRQRRVDPRQ